MERTTNKKAMLNQAEIEVRGSCYYFLKGNSEVKISNFTMRVVFFIMSSLNPIRVVEITNDEGIKIRFDMPADSMRNPDAFCKTLEARGNYIFNGNKNALFALKHYLFKGERIAYDFAYLGYQKKFNVYAFSNGIYDSEGTFHFPDSDGIVSISDRSFYLPSSESIENRDEESENQIHKLFVNVTNDLTFEEWSRLYLKTYGPKAIMCISFVLAAMHRDIIFDQIHCMPLLFLAGKPQSGKSTARRGLMNLFGHEQSPIQCGMGSTPKAISRKLGQFSNALVSVEEYKNDIDQRLIETLKGAYDGEGYERAKKTQDNQTHTTLVLSSIIITGQHLPTKESALFSRCILVSFTQTEFNEAERSAFEKLKSIQENGLSHLTGKIFKYRSIVKKEFSEIFNQTSAYLKSLFLNSPVSDRIINNYASILTPFLCLRKNAFLDFSFVDFDILKEAERILLEQVEHFNASNESNHFWETFKLLMDERDKLLETTHYQIKERDNRQIIYLRMAPVLDLYREYCIKRKIYNALEGRTLVSYLKNDKSFVKGPGNGGCHYLNVGGERKNFLGFDTNLLQVKILDEKLEIKTAYSNFPIVQIQPDSQAESLSN